MSKPGKDARSSRETVQHQMWGDGWEGKQSLLSLLLLLMVEKVRDYCQYHVPKGTQKYLNHNNIHSQSEIVESQQYTHSTQSI